MNTQFSNRSQVVILINHNENGDFNRTLIAVQCDCARFTI